MTYHSPPIQDFHAGGRQFTLEVAASAEQQSQGLGGRQNMPANHGMLFVFSAPAEHCFWMKDMRFPLDIIWLDAEKRIMKIDADISPDTYPTAFCSDGPTQYVIELNAGEAARAGLRTGQQLDI